MFGLDLSFITGATSAAAFTKILDLKCNVGVSPGTVGSGIDSIADQSGSGNTFTSTSPNRPVYTANQFISGTQASIYYGTATDYSTASGKIVCASGMTIFMCFKTQGTSTTTGNTNINPPMTYIGDNNTTTSRNQFGLSGGTMRYCYKVAGTTWTTYNGTSTTLNDGNVHTMALTHDLSGNLVLYADNVSKLSTTAVTYDTGNTGIRTLGVGYNLAEYARDMNLANLQIYNGIVDTTTLGSLHTAAISLYT